MPQDELAKHPITRRDFMRAAAVGAAAAGLGLWGDACRSEPSSPVQPAQEPPLQPPSQAVRFLGQRGKVVLIRDTAVIDDRTLVVNEEVVQQMLNAALCAYTGKADAKDAWAFLFEPQHLVGIKMSDMMTATHPELVRAIARGLRLVGVEEQNIYCWDRNRAGAGVDGVSNRTWQPGYGSDHVSKVVPLCNKLVNAPGLKSHWLAGMAGALKNWAGAVEGINIKDDNPTFAIHANSCEQCSKLNNLPPIRMRSRLVVLDCIRPLFHGGPQVDPEYLWNYKGLIVAEDPVAADTIGLRILRAKRNEFKGETWPLSPPVTHLAYADKEYGLGESDPDKISLTKLGWEADALV